MEVVGTSWVGAYIGRNNISESDTTKAADKNVIYVNACNTANTVVNGSQGCCGGIIGGSHAGYPSIYVNTATRKSGDTLPIGDDGCYTSTMKLSMTNLGDRAQCGIGAVAGTIRNGYNVNLWVNNLTVEGCGDNKGFINTSTSERTTWSQGVGGLFGFVRKAESVVVTNCTIHNLSIQGPMSGGLFGNIDLYDDKTDWGVSPKIKIYNCDIHSDDKNDYSIKGLIGAGGISGQFITSKTYSNPVTGYNGESFIYDADGCEVYEYTIRQTSTANKQYGAGGLIGYAKTAQRTIVNSSVHDCIIEVDGSQGKHGMGGIVGNTEFAIWGYNISAYDNVFKFYNSGTSAKYGCFIGNSNSKELKVVGFTRKNNRLNNALFTADYGNGVASGSYIIDADYMNISTGNNHGNSMAVGFDNGTNVGEGAAKNYFPYVTVSPKTSMGGTNFLTGDGINIIEMENVVNNESVTNDVPIAKLIVNENKGTAADNRVAYKTVGSSDINTVEELLTLGEDTSNDYDIKLTTYFREMGVPTGYEGFDFPIISINGGATNYNSYINAYIRTLTNTTDTYTADVAGKYSISIYPCQCIDGVYQKVSGTTGFQRNASGNYIMDDTQADSIAGNNQISMIDVSFLDPTDASKTAYHLYVPVLTKKLLKFNFSSTALQGTEYEKGVYEDKIPENWGDISKLGAGFDSWQTIYAKFDYTKEEMDEFLKTGKGLNWNTAKTIQFRYNSNKSLATSTEYVLLDNN